MTLKKKKERQKASTYILKWERWVFAKIHSWCTQGVDIFDRSYFRAVMKIKTGFILTWKTSLQSYLHHLADALIQCDLQLFHICNWAIKGFAQGPSRGSLVNLGVKLITFWAVVYSNILNTELPLPIPVHCIPNDILHTLYTMTHFTIECRNFRNVVSSRMWPEI